MEMSVDRDDLEIIDADDFTPDEGSPEDSRDAWCEEYHPKLTYSECADVAGW